MPNKNALLFKTALTYVENEAYHKAIKIFKKILENDIPVDISNKIKEQLSYCYLAIGDLKNAWKLYGYRESGFEYNNFLTSHVNIPLWDGTQDLSDKKLLLLAEEGIGDELLYSTAFNLLQYKCKAVFIECDKRLRPLYERSYGRISFFNRNEDGICTYLSKVDIVGLIGDVTRYLNPDFSNDTFYLLPNKSKSYSFRKELENKHGGKVFVGGSYFSNGKYTGKILVGVSYFSNGKNKEHRSPPKEFWDNILNISDRFIFINLQENDQTNPDKRSFLYDHEKLHHADGIDLYNDIDGLASLIDSMDVVISINNYVSHLAGRIDKFTFLLLERMCNCRVLLRTNDRRSLWYPSTAVLKGYSWDEVNEDLEYYLSCALE